MLQARFSAVWKSLSSSAILHVLQKLPSHDCSCGLHSAPNIFFLKLFFCLSSCQDAEGRAPIHVAISNQHGVIIQLLISHPDIRLNVRDRQGMTPFACAMTHKNNKAAEAIIKREPGAAEQVSLKPMLLPDNAFPSPVDFQLCFHIRSTTRAAISSMWLSRIRTLKACCSSLACRLMSTPGFRTQPNSPPCTWPFKPDRKSSSATWCAYLLHISVTCCEINRSLFRFL